MDNEKTVDVWHTSCDTWPQKNAIEWLNTIVKVFNEKVPEGVKAGAYFEFEKDYGYDHDVDIVMYLRYDRPESEAERSMREAEERSDNERKDRQDRKRYKELKAKFEGE